MLFYCDKLKCFVIISGMLGLGQKRSKASSTASVLQKSVLSLPLGLGSRRLLGRRRFCLLLMGGARRKHLNAV